MWSAGELPPKLLAHSSRVYGHLGPKPTKEWSSNFGGSFTNGGLWRVRICCTDSLCIDRDRPCISFNTTPYLHFCISERDGCHLAPLYETSGRSINSSLCTAGWKVPALSSGAVKQCSCLFVLSIAFEVITWCQFAAALLLGFSVLCCR